MDSFICFGEQSSLFKSDLNFLFSSFSGRGGVPDGVINNNYYYNLQYFYYNTVVAPHY